MKSQLLQVLKLLKDIKTNIGNEGSLTRQSIAKIDTHLMRKYTNDAAPKGILVETLEELRESRTLLEALTSKKLNLARLTSDWTVSFFSADDGYNLFIENQLIGKERGHASGFNPPHSFRLFDIVVEHYVSAVSSQNQQEQDKWEPIITNIINESPIKLEIHCWNAGGPSQVTFDITGGLGSVAKTRVNGNHSGGITRKLNYHIQYDALLNQDILVKA